MTGAGPDGPLRRRAPVAMEVEAEGSQHEGALFFGASVKRNRSSPAWFGPMTRKVCRLVSTSAAQVLHAALKAAQGPSGR